MPTSDIQLIIFLSKICFVLTLAWCLRFAIGNRNPKGVVLIWRIHFVALSLVCVGLFFPPLWSLSSFPLIGVRLPVAIVVHSSAGPKFSDLGSDLGSGSFVETLLLDEISPRPSPNYMSSRELVPTDRQSETEVTEFNFESVEDLAENRSVVVLQTQAAIALPLVPNGALQSGNGTENMALTRPFQITGSVSNDRDRKSVV